MGAYRMIILKGDYGRREEGEAAGAISPGMAVELQPTGKYLVPQGTQAEVLKRRELKLAIEDRLQGKTIDDAYANGDRLFFYIPQPGDEMHVLVKSGQNIAVGDRLIVEAGGSGLFVEAAGTEAAYQLEAMESSGGALAANDHIVARVL